MTDLSFVRELRAAALEESRALRDEAALAMLAGHIPADGWGVRAACLGARDVFFPMEGAGPAAHDPAREICGGCKVGLSCLAENLDETHGCFGGTTPTHRRRIRKALRASGLERVHVSVEMRRQNREAS